MTTWLCNAFSLNMLDSSSDAFGVTGEKLSEAEVLALLDGEYTNAVGHQSTCDLLNAVLGLELVANRATVKLAAGDVALVAQYTGPRLDEGVTELPAGAQLVFWRVVLA